MLGWPCRTGVALDDPGGSLPAQDMLRFQCDSDPIVIPERCAAFHHKMEQLSRLSLPLLARLGALLQPGGVNFPFLGPRSLSQGSFAAWLSEFCFPVSPVPVPGDARIQTCSSHSPSGSTFPAQGTKGALGAP